MNEYIIRHEQLEKIFDWIDALTVAAYGEEAEEYKGKRLALYEQLEIPPIVRCKDCKHLNCIKDKKGRITYYGCFVFRASVEPDGFCAWGKRKEVEE